MKTPLGILHATFDGKALVRLEIADQPSCMPDSLQRELESYFNGTLKEFRTEVRFAGTPFQIRVWKELCKIPYGKTISYAELARRVGNEKACRAVGSANGKNPLLLLVPCHRVINADGAIGGYRAGVEQKQWLLKHEMLWR